MEKENRREVLVPPFPTVFFKELKDELYEIRYELMKWKDSGERIGIFTHDDGDGICSAEILRCFFDKSLVYIPDRRQVNYGFSREIADLLISQGISRLIIADNALKSIDGISYARNKGISVILIDHHMPGRELPEANILYNPQIEGHFYLKNQCAAALCYIIVAPICNPAFYEKILCLAAMGTQSDYIPHLGLARSILYHGFLLFPKIYSIIWNALEENLLQEKWYQTIRIINFLRGTDGKHYGYDLLKNPVDNFSFISMAVKGLEDQETEIEKIMSIAEIHDNYIIGDFELLEVEKVGLVASRLLRKHGKLSIVIGKQGRGEIRSLPGFSCTDFLELFRDHFSSYGGHLNAAGFSLKDNLKKDFKEVCDQILIEKEIPESSRNEPEYILSPEEYLEIKPSFVCSMPYGNSNPVPYIRIMKGNYIEKVFREVKGFEEKRIEIENNLERQGFIEVFFHGDGLIFAGN
ncbi:MAG: hypothetical protein JXA60_06710 [Candidatus Coatesbacteria bacterium]|nr:hypothetical protein [Candidatus Coatesbacteria bacterium]